MIRVLIFNEFIQEKTQENVKVVYPNGIHECLKEALCEEFEVKVVTQDDENCGITKEVLDNTDVLLWWAHAGHDTVPDEVADLVHDAVLRGMGAIFLHSAHYAKPFRKLMGTSCSLHWREDGDFERVWVINPAHPIAQGVGEYLYIEHEETYGEPFDIPQPDQEVFIGAYEGGEVFRSGCCFLRGNGKVFYFQPGHETFPVYYNEQVRKVLRNAVRWCYNSYRIPEITCPHVTKPQD